eukprot:CAMPEP_0113693420 /NCGR_PEP_ID=MMETSP0038_2-20120614/19653_1 /TAXON_ID=2898 /ORGANISM="Cryptomonas paramecium" /LENGTH=391 /DNA_ID=CAMNT_0000615487 /DNA_START=59 /DNA_END=1230 /DNA_ORIENTATION=+ /assembly_acc=CAM_ASM_000170
MAAAIDHRPVNDQIHTIDTKLSAISLDRADEDPSLQSLETLPQDDDFYKDDSELIVVATDKPKTGFFGRLKNSLSWSRVDKPNENAAVTAVMSCRSPAASQLGGIGIQDPNQAKLCRSVLALMIRQMGKNLLKGANVMNVSFPIQCCQPATILEVASYQAGFFNHYLPRASAASDPVERMKNVVAAMVSVMVLTSGNFLKPLNPILGETLQVDYEDGSRLFMEQTCHHPPVSSFSFRGAESRYHYYGYTTFDIGFGYNKMNIRTSGLRIVDFPDGGRVTVGFPHDRWGNVFWGEMHHECLGSLDFEDEAHGLRCTIRFGEGGRSMPSDYFEGTIERTDAAGGEPVVVSTVTGSWVGFVDFDKERYWDVRSSTAMRMWAAPAPLLSDSRARP